MRKSDIVLVGLVLLFGGLLYPDRPAQMDVPGEAVWSGYGAWSHYKADFCPVWDDPLGPPTRMGWADGHGWSTLFVYIEHWYSLCNDPVVDGPTHYFTFGWRPGHSKESSVTFKWNEHWYTASLQNSDGVPYTYLSYFPDYMASGVPFWYIDWKNASWCDQEYSWTCYLAKVGDKPWHSRSAEEGPPS